MTQPKTLPLNPRLSIVRPEGMKPFVIIHVEQVIYPNGMTTIFGIDMINGKYIECERRHLYWSYNPELN